MLVGAVGLITEAEQARDIVRSDEQDRNIDEEATIAEQTTDASGEKEAMADCILAARQFMREPELVLRVSRCLATIIFLKLNRDVAGCMEARR